MMEPSAWNRTGDLRFTKPVLYQLSYDGAPSCGVCRSVCEADKHSDSIQ